VNDDNQIIKIDTGYHSLKFEFKNNDIVITNVDYIISVKKEFPDYNIVAIPSLRRQKRVYTVNEDMLSLLLSVLAKKFTKKIKKFLKIRV
jgi:hypothetical protein